MSGGVAARKLGPFSLACAAVGRGAKENPLAIVGHVLGGAAIGALAWAVSCSVDHDATSALRVKERPQFLGGAPEVTNALIDIQELLITEAAQPAFEEAVLQIDNLMQLEQTIDRGEVRASTSEIVQANGYVRRTMTALRQVRDTVSEAKVNIINRHIVRVAELLHAHVANIRSASMVR